MPLGGLRSDGPGRVELGDGISKVTSRVNSDGRTTVQIHANPQALATWIDKFLTTFGDGKDGTSRKSRDGFPGHEPDAPVPRLNIAIHIVGSRGDVQPFIPIAQLLSQPPYGHRVRICTHAVFKDFVESNGVEFFSIGGDPEALMAYMVKNPGLLPSRESFKAGDIGKRRREMAEIMEGVWRSCIEAGDGIGPRVTAADAESTSDLFIADAIIANPPSMAHIHCAEKLGVPLHMVFTMPWSPTRSFHHPLASMQYKDAEPSVANYMSFVMMELLTWQGLGDVINKFRVRTLKLDPISPLWGHQLLPRLRVPYTYLWPESLIPKPHDWGHYIKIASFSFLPQASSYTPPPELVEFLQKGPPPVYIGFGSIVLENPEALTKLIFEAVESAGVRAIVSQGWGGLGGGSVPENIFLVGNCPHDWLFQRVSAVVHHGGAGTTAAGLAAGRPTVVVPFFGDQPFWGQMVARAGAGPAPVPFKEMTAESLAASITFALKPEVQKAAAEVSRQIEHEDGAGAAATDVHQRLEIENLRCDVTPNRLAVWEDKATGAHLSGFAASVLIQNGKVKRQHLKLLRHKHWYVDEGAEHPVLGAIATASGTFMELAAATRLYIDRLQRPTVPRTRRASLAMLTPTLTREVTRKKSEGAESDENNGSPFTAREMQQIAIEMATKSFPSSEDRMRARGPLCRDRNSKQQSAGQGGRFRNAARATGSFAFDLAKVGAKAPVSFFYNMANGFRNSPSYTWNGLEARRRTEITGFKSGFKVAGEEFALEFYSAFSGLILDPYQRGKKEGAKGFGKGVLQAGHGLIFHTMAALFALPGYSMKGIEKGLSKRQLTRLKAEIILIRMRQAIDEHVGATEEEKDEVLARWNALHKEA
ncbi:UDP-Glycosyltransferase/glycogen phosphorylase [Thozetella sp. PMI_491]|nr:UDP-Glycosyltransferase/glycogen phosphorylase [Thozetella sp. PMI_491]